MTRARVDGKVNVRRPLDVYERVDGGGEAALAQIGTSSELDNENSPGQIFPLKDPLSLCAMSE